MAPDIDLITVHCSATPPDLDVGAAKIDDWHRARGWRKIGYSFVVRRGGQVETGRAVGETLAHARGHNRKAIAICLVGGVDANNQAEINFTEAQRATLAAMLTTLEAVYPNAVVNGHRDLPGVNKDCPCFDVAYFRPTGQFIEAKKRG